MADGIAVVLLIVAAIAAATLGFDLTEAHGGLLPWIAFGLSLSLAGWALIEAIRNEPSAL